MRILLPVLLTTLLAASCAISNVTRITNSKYPAIDKDDVKIFLDEDDLPYDFEKVAIIVVNYSRTYDNVKWNKAKEKAAKLGCNGVYERNFYPGYGDDGDRSEIIAIKY